MKEPDTARELLISREQVRDAAGGEDASGGERQWAIVASALGIRPGLAFMIATGVPADGSGVPDLAGRIAGPLAINSPQSLVNPRGHNPLRNEPVEAWVRERAARELAG